MGSLNKDADFVIVEVSKKVLDVAFVNPTNVEREKKQFFRSRSYDPYFGYHRYDWSLVKQKLLRLEFEDDEIGRLLKSSQKFLLSYINSLEKIGKPDFTNTSLYGAPSKELVSHAYEMLNTLKDEPNPPQIYKAKEILIKINQHLKKIKFSDWSVILSSALSGGSGSFSRCDINSAAKVIRLAKDATASESTMKKLLVHEIDCHVLRSMNGREQDYTIFASEAIPGYLPTEEGLAGLHERWAGVSGNTVLRRYAGRVVAVHMALRHSFRDIYRELTKFFGRETAFNYALRAKRGIADTSKKGGFIKDHVYLRGMELMDKFVKEGKDLTSLYAGKIGVQHLRLVEQGVIHPPKYLPSILPK